MIKCLPMILAFTSIVCFSDDPVITQDKGKYTVSTQAYSVAIDPDGKIKSLKAGDIEFISKAGCYLYADNKGLGFGKVTSPGGGVLSIEGDKTAMGLSFKSDEITWSVKNKTLQTFTLVLVFAKEVSAFRNENGEYFRTPIVMSLKQSAWFRGEACVEMDSPFATRGPWGEGWQVLTVTVTSQETRKIGFKIRK
ncbi:MAG: hypothetical protein WC637_15375, partial [Victivallales bacterium]